MAQEVFLYPKPPIDFQDMVGSGTIAISTTGQKLTFSANNGQTFFQLRNGARPRLIGVSNDVSAGGETSITFHLKVNGARISKQPFDSFDLALGETYRSDSRLSVPIDLPQGALIEVECDNSSASAAYIATIRIRVEYESLT